MRSPLATFSLKRETGREGDAARKSTSFSGAEIDLIIKAAADHGDSSMRSPWAEEMRRLFRALPGFEFQTERGTPLEKLCAAGAHHGWSELEKNMPCSLAALLSGKAKASLRRNLQRDLEWITRPCFDLEWTSFGVALRSLGLAPSRRAPTDLERMFLRDRPGQRLYSLFRVFPVLARLWCQLLRQWRGHVEEVLQRFKQDRPAVSRLFFSNRPLGSIQDAHLGLSDRHHSGRTVVRLLFERDSIIYKPRSGRGEAEWSALLDWTNRRGFQPAMRPARVLVRHGYCWMEYVAPTPLKSKAAARRFYERMGGIVAAAYLCRAVDCHRDNLIASGEQPVLVDVDALWHVPPSTGTESARALLYRTGFFPDQNPRSLQSRSSAFGTGAAGKHLPRLAGRPLRLAPYRRELAHGFARAWRCILGTRQARRAFARRLVRIRSTRRRWIYWPTETYASVRDASIQPGALRSNSEREVLIRLRCARDEVPSSVVEAEARALKNLDIPYFLGRTDHPLPPERSPISPELMKALCTAPSKARKRPG